ncbi:hypothetical protein AAHA92_02586 [Salvia divinorum]|uniref:Uncharacterized protein n=1 Tax=Salvia divinorum TaxID=28513 RepID=A0ABD1IFE6_SALDI
MSQTIRRSIRSPPSHPGHRRVAAACSAIASAGVASTHQPLFLVYFLFDGVELLLTNLFCKGGEGVTFCNADWESRGVFLEMRGLGF